MRILIFCDTALLGKPDFDDSSINEALEYLRATEALEKEDQCQLGSKSDAFFNSSLLEEYHVLTSLRTSDILPPGTVESIFNVSSYSTINLSLFLLC